LAESAEVAVFAFPFKAPLKVVDVTEPFTTKLPSDKLNNSVLPFLIIKLLLLFKNKFVSVILESSIQELKIFTEPLDPPFKVT